MSHAPGKLALLLVLLTHLAMPPLQAWPDSEQDQQAATAEQSDQAQRREGEAILSLADAAMAGRTVPTDFEVGWQNDFIKAQSGTFVPFTLTFDARRFRRPEALVYVRATRRGAAGDEAYPVDAIFPIELPSLGESGDKPVRVSRGFSIAPGDYDVYIVVRERSDPKERRPQATRAERVKTAVLKHAIVVPEFATTGLTTSSLILADRMTPLPHPVSQDELAERPYAIGQNDITPAADAVFRRDEELIVLLLVYNPTVAANRLFDVQVEYHFYRRASGRTAEPEAVVQMKHPPELPGERYFNHTDPQRFNPALMGPQFDPSAGQPVMAGQVVPLGGFADGDYRLAVQVTDLLSGTSIQRDVRFKVGS